MVSCFFKGCGKIRKKYQPYSRAHYFRIPRDNVMFQKWKNAIPDLNKYIRNRICSIHFEEKDIIQYFEEQMPDGTLWHLKRDNVRLQHGAVPSRYLQLCRKKKLLEDDASSTDDDPESTIKDSFDFSVLKMEKDNITDSRWTVTVADKFVGFLFWNPSFCISKHVLIFEDLKIKAFFNGIESDLFANAKIDSMSTLGGILKDIGDMKLCESSLKQHNCTGYVLNNSDTFCDSCVESSEIESQFSFKKTKRRKQILPKKANLESKVIVEKIL